MYVELLIIFNYLGIDLTNVNMFSVISVLHIEGPGSDAVSAQREDSVYMITCSKKYICMNAWCP